MWDRPVEPEPPFQPFFDHVIAPVDGDDGRKHTLLSGLIDWLHQKVTGQGNNTSAQTIEESPGEFEPIELAEPSDLVELRISLPQNLDVSQEAAEQFLLSLSTVRRPVAFELIGLPETMIVQFACEGDDAAHLEQQLRAIFPDVTVSVHAGLLQEYWQEPENAETVIAEFGLAREFMLPLAMPGFSVDPLTGIAGALVDVREDEIALLQILFQPVRHPWAQSVLRSVTFSDGTPLFEGMRDFVKQGRNKVSRPLYGAVIRACCQSPEGSRTWDMVRHVSGALSVLSDAQGNELIPLDNDNYDPTDHEHDVLFRRSRRCGMLLNSEELTSLVHLPSASVRIPKLRGQAKKTKPVPPMVLGHQTVLGINEHAGRSQSVTMSPDQRSKHLHLIGASGTGKSTLLLNLIIQDINKGDGVAVLDPHGDLVDAVLQRIPPQRRGDVVLFDPGDEDYPVGFNILSAHSELEKNLLSSDLVAVFRRFSTSWGDQMNAVLGNAIIAFLESERGGTLVDLRRFLVEAKFRKEFLSSVRDPEIVYYWAKEFPLLSGRAQAPVLTRLDAFLRPKLIRYMVGQKQSKLDLGQVMDNGGILLARLSHGAIGEENAQLLGTMLVSKLHQMALGRQRIAETDRKYFWLYIDEFQNFATPSMAAILTGARKYRLGLVPAHQELHQLTSKTPEVASAVMSNAFTRVCFRLGDEDAKKLAGGFASFEPIDLQNLSTGEAICRVERAELDFNLRTLPLAPVDEQTAATARQEAITASRQRYAVPRANVEAELCRSPGDEEAGVQEAKVWEKPDQNVDIKLPEPVLAPPSTPVGPKPVPRPQKVTSDVMIEPPPQGRGGPEHKYLQQLIKQYAEGLGFKASIEENILGGKGVDVALTKCDTSIACEICITTDDAHELGNVQKCLTAGYKHVAVISPSANRLKSLEKAISPQLADDQRSRVKFFAPEELLRFIQQLEVQQLTQEKIVRGYKIKTSFKVMDEADGDIRRQAVSQTVAKAIKRLQDRKAKK